jgi:hypothetical protein
MSVSTAVGLPRMLDPGSASLPPAKGCALGAYTQIALFPHKCHPRRAGGQLMVPSRRNYSVKHALFLVTPMIAEIPISAATLAGTLANMAPL